MYNLHIRQATLSLSAQQVEWKILHRQYISIRHLINTGHENSVDAVDDLRLADRHVEHVHVRKSCPVFVVVVVVVVGQYLKIFDDI